MCYRWHQIHLNFHIFPQISSVSLKDQVSLTSLLGPILMTVDLVDGNLHTVSKSKEAKPSSHVERKQHTFHYYTFFMILTIGFCTCIVFVFQVFINSYFFNIACFFTKIHKLMWKTRVPRPVPWPLYVARYIDTIHCEIFAVTVQINHHNKIAHDIG